MRDSKTIIYSLNIEDVLTVASEDMETELTREELNLAIDRLPGYIDWRQAIDFAIQEARYRIEKANQEHAKLDGRPIESE